MAIDINSSEGQEIRKFIPLATLSGMHFEALCTELFIEQAEKGDRIIKQGDNDEFLIYLLEGEISLQAKGLIVETIKAGSTAAEFAIAHQNPRQIDIIASRHVQYLSIKRDLLEKPPVVYREQENNYLVNESNEEEEEDDWMAILLRSPLFRHLPPQSLQQIILALEEVSFVKDNVIIRQNDEGDYFYLIKRGYCQISRKPSPKSKEIKLAQLRVNDSFGEDALIAEEVHNFSVTALTNCSLLRLNKSKFLTLIKEPAQQFIDYDNLMSMQDAQIIDVRLPDEYKIKHLDGSINMPYFSLRMQMKNLDREQKVVITCDDGKTSEAASFLLFKSRFDPIILRSGLSGIKNDISKPSAQFEIFDGVGMVLNHEKKPKQQEQQKSQQADQFKIEPTVTSMSQSRATAEEVKEETVVESEFSLDISQIEAYEDSLADQVDKLSSENERLKQNMQKLHAQYKKLMQEKKLLEKKLITVVKQKNELQQQLKS